MAFSLGLPPKAVVAEISFSAIASGVRTDLAFFRHGEPLVIRTVSGVTGVGHYSSGRSVILTPASFLTQIHTFPAWTMSQPAS